MRGRADGPGWRKGLVVHRFNEKSASGESEMADGVPLHLKVIGSDGNQVATECVPATKLSDVHFRLTRTPAMVLGVARGDVVELIDGKTGDFRVLTRSGLLSVQVFCRGTQQKLSAKLNHLAHSNQGFFESHDQRETEGGTVSVITVSLPASLGFERVELLLDQALADTKEAEWFYGNVYDPADGVTPLKWWE
jgi:hypothetical protein